MKRAVVFAYHDVGVRCLATLLAHDVDVQLVVTHQDNPAENIWFASVAVLARSHDLTVITPDRVDDPALLAQLQSIAPDFIFSFYYRHLLAPSLLAIASRGALNMHGSLLPQYRGRVPVNWAVIRGATQTGASLHYMVAKPDAGDLVDQLAVPIHPDDDALAVFRKVTLAAELVLDRSLPGVLAGSAPRRALDLTTGSYFGGRKPEDGRIDWCLDARSVHNLVRGVAPPYPGAFTTLQGQIVKILETRVDAAIEPAPISATSERGTDASQPGQPGQPGQIILRGDRCHVHCGSGSLRVLRAGINGKDLTMAELAQRAGDATLFFI